MTAHILRLTTKGVNQRGQTLYTAHCQLGCWRGTMTAADALAKQDEHMEAIGGAEAQNARETS